MIRTGESRLVDGAWVAVAGVLVIVAVALAQIAPPDAVQGGIQKLMYLHVPSALSAYLCYSVVLLASAWFLIRRSATAQDLARTAAITGVTCTGLTLLTGSIWGSVTWGTWWAWDPRITSTLAMGLVYAAYIGLHHAVVGRAGQTFVAVVGIAAFASAPIVHFSVIWWRTLHQEPTILAPSLSPPIDGQMGIALGASICAAAALATLVIRARMGRLRARQARTAMEQADPLAQDVPTVAQPVAGAGGPR
ncbi:cytochrome c biogenesis protein CcsA [Microbacterium sp. LRZ72]|uniref:cytochrome c biogenesis protein CcsA n=1 Tax=Microbacterium sp. LRZ72 TaxID=2942481 RepID=UPI0029B48DA2|nr:cytochrome c biogenesis protein CcsA [Microbacterium sp. LRZ72]MDX2377257.1 cytochrome c biogenesis protein CcsA [Microbacterium sp. LRZ72]